MLLTAIPPSLMGLGYTLGYLGTQGVPQAMDTSGACMYGMDDKAAAARLWVFSMVRTPKFELSKITLYTE